MPCKRARTVQWRRCTRIRCTALDPSLRAPHRTEHLSEPARTPDAQSLRYPRGGPPTPRRSSASSPGDDRTRRNSEAWLFAVAGAAGVWITLRPRPARWQSSSSGWYSGYDLALGLRRRHRRQRPARQSNHRHDLTRGGCSAGTRGVLKPVASGSPSPSSPARTARPGCRTDLRQGSGCRPGPRQAAPGTSHLPARDHRLPLAGHRP